MIKSELKSIIKECISEILSEDCNIEDIVENKEDIQRSYRSREVADHYSGDHSKLGKYIHDYSKKDYKTGFANSNAGYEGKNNSIDKDNGDLLYAKKLKNSINDYDKKQDEYFKKLNI